MYSEPIWNSTALLWYCDPCNLWWCSEPTGQPNTWRLIRLEEPALDSAWKTKCPAWNMAGPDPSACPECLARMTAQLGLGQEEISVVFQPRPEVLALFN